MKVNILFVLLGMLLFSFPLLAKENAETAYDRILRTQTIRCGYSVWEPVFGIDMKTGEKRGIFHDLMEEIGRRLDLKIVWQEELGWGTVLESVRSGRVDMACSGYWLNPPRMKNALSSIPQLYSPLYVWVRQDDRRMHGIDDLNAAGFTTVAVDGGASTQILAKRFPKANYVRLPELTSTPDMLINLTSKKADFIVVDAATMDDYMAANPGKVRNAFPDQPLNMYPNVLLLPPGDFRLKDMMDNILRDIEYDGTLDDILKKYHAGPSFLRNPPPSAR